MEMQFYFEFIKKAQSWVIFALREYQSVPSFFPFRFVASQTSLSRYFNVYFFCQYHTSLLFFHNNFM